MKTLFTGQSLLRVDTVGSTNSYALDWLRENDLAEGTVIVAQNQAGGRGQRGNSWESEPGKNLTVSFIFKPHFLQVTRQFDLTRAVSLAIADLLAVFLPAAELKIKWPNDILVNGRKVCGILIENILRDTQISAAVVGIGLNVNQEVFHSAVHAVSMKNAAGKTFDLQTVLESLCEMLEARYLQLRSGHETRLRSDYHAILFGMGAKKRFNRSGEIFEATVLGTTDAGLLRLAAGEEERNFNLKELSWI
ncbi:MAG: biotin-(acetyl-CoA-carboxylase) ligase BirA [Bacteroidetes bacterium]|nr:MAG: biotin-(acetyl-CoA-carboxylase) ligase BirA [Bacteroidota bacterium]